MVARAIAVLRFPLVFMIFAMVTTLKFAAEGRADRSECNKLRVVKPVHVDFFGDFHRYPGKLRRDTDVALDALKGVNAAWALVGEHTADGPLN